jgi:hypothetical protein
LPEKDKELLSLEEERNHSMTRPMFAAIESNIEYGKRLIWKKNLRKYKMI